MNVNPLLQDINAKTFLQDYLEAKGVIDVKKYLHPDGSCFDSCWDYPNIEEAIDLFHAHKEDKIGIVIDSDMDGACSAALTTIFLKSLGVGNYQVFAHNGKQHGITDLVEQILEADIDFLFIPDAGTNEVESCKVLKEHGIDIVVLDHHLVEKPNPYAIIVNPYLGDGLNTKISGTGVVYKFCEAYYSRYKGCEWAECGNTMDIVAVSLVSDVCDLSSLENRAFIEYGLSDPDNEFLCHLFTKKCTRRGVTPEGISWDVAPLGNALARSDEQETKLLFFKALVGEIDFEEALKDITRVKRQQDNAVKAVVEELEPTLDMSHKAIVGFSDAENKSFLGLIANKFCGANNKPVFLFRELNKDKWSGSMRSPVPLAEKINESGLATAQGHEEACGVFLKKSNLDRFISWLDTLDLSTKPAIDVTACVKPEALNTQLMKSIQDKKVLWGKGMEQPTFFIKQKVKSSQVFVFEKKTTTIKVVCGDLSCIKFFAKPEDVEAFKKYDEFELEMVIGDCGVNEWEGVVTPQGVIKEYEIKPIEKKEESWEDLF